MAARLVSVEASGMVISVVFPPSEYVEDAANWRHQVGVFFTGAMRCQAEAVANLPLAAPPMILPTRDWRHG